MNRRPLLLLSAAILLAGSMRAADPNPPAAAPPPKPPVISFPLKTTPPPSLPALRAPVSGNSGNRKEATPDEVKKLADEITQISDQIFALPADAKPEVRKALVEARSEKLRQWTAIAERPAQYPKLEPWIAEQQPRCIDAYQRMLQLLESYRTDWNASFGPAFEAADAADAATVPDGWAPLIYPEDYVRAFPYKTLQNIETAFGVNLLQEPTHAAWTFKPLPINAVDLNPTGRYLGQFSPGLHGTYLWNDETALRTALREAVDSLPAELAWLEYQVAQARPRLKDATQRFLSFRAAERRYSQAQKRAAEEFKANGKVSPATEAAVRQTQRDETVRRLQTDTAFGGLIRVFSYPNLVAFRWLTTKPLDPQLRPTGHRGMSRIKACESLETLGGQLDQALIAAAETLPTEGGEPPAVTLLKKKLRLLTTSIRNIANAPEVNPDDLSRFVADPAAAPMPGDRIAWVQFRPAREITARMTALNPQFEEYYFGQAAMGIPFQLLVQFSGEDFPSTPLQVSLRCGTQTMALKTKPPGGLEEFFFAPPKRDPVPLPPVPVGTELVDEHEDDSSPPSVLAGFWKVAIEDAHLGIVEGRAEVDHKGQNALVTFIHPQSHEKVLLQSSSIEEARPGEFVLKMRGPIPPWPTSPGPPAQIDPHLAPPKPPGAALPRLEIADDAKAIEISVNEWTGSTPIAPLPYVPPPPTVEVKLRWAELHHELGPYLSAPPLKARFQGYWQIPADPVTRQPLLQAGREAYFTRTGENPNRAIQFGRETWMVPPKPLLQYYAQTAYGPLQVERLFEGVSMVVEAVFSTAQEQATSVIHLKFGGQDLELQANRDPYDYRRFTTDPFVPGTASPVEVQP